MCAQKGHNSTSLIFIFFSSGGGGDGEVEEREFFLLLCGDIGMLLVPNFFSSSLSSRVLAGTFPSSVLYRDAKMT